VFRPDAKNYGRLINKITQEKGLQEACFYASNGLGIITPEISEPSVVANYNPGMNIPNSPTTEMQ
jgi:hypothetical protein